jgi:hypothetical protein
MSLTIVVGDIDGVLEDDEFGELVGAALRRTAEPPPRALGAIQRRVTLRRPDAFATPHSRAGRGDTRLVVKNDSPRQGLVKRKMRGPGLSSSRRVIST